MRGSRSISRGRRTRRRGASLPGFALSCTAALAVLAVLAVLGAGRAPGSSGAGPPETGVAARAGLREEEAGARLEGTALVRGMTVSCQTNGREWGTDGFGRELDRLARLGVNWVAVHPYARITADGEVRWRRFDPDDPPASVARPIREAHARGMAILVKPHLAYWGSPFRWRGDIDFPDEAARERFFAGYREWIAALARATRAADAFCVGCELDRLIGHEAEWRAIVADVRAATPARLTYAANWTDYARVPFWDALDCVGIQAYFPLAEGDDPGPAELRSGWTRVLAELRGLHERTGKPVVFTELGYDLSLEAARRPWTSGRRSRESRPESGAESRATAEALQARCLRAALDVLDREREWLRGAFLWKWFVGPAPGEDFLMDTPSVRGILREAWADGRPR